MMKSIDHIAIAVTDIKASSASYQLLLGVEPSFETVESEGVKVACFHLSDHRVELISPTSNDNSVSKFIQKKGEGIHHVAFKVGDLQLAIDNCKKDGFTMIHDSPQQGAEGCQIAFMHPKDLNGVLVELIQTV